MASKIKRKIRDINRNGIKIIAIYYKDNRKYYICLCVCGKETTIRSDTFNKFKSCGCKGKQIKTPYTHINGTEIDKIKLGYITKGNTSGIPGVSYDKSRKIKTWIVQIRFQRKRYFLGRYSTLEEAAQIRERAELLRIECFNKTPEDFHKLIKEIIKP